MFTNANILIDEYQRPVFVIEEKLDSGDCAIELDETGITFKLNKETVGKVSDISEHLLFLISAQKTVGIVAHEKGEEIPDHYTHSATITDLLNNN